jgi:hypothetical protein
MKTPAPTAGELIRALLPFFNGNSYDLNLAVAAWRRENASRSWVVAAEELLDYLEITDI